MLPNWLTIDAIFHPRLLEYFPDWETHGIFQTSEMSFAPWVHDDEYPISPAVLDLIYFANRSGEKLPSPLVKRLAGSDPDPGLTTAQVDKLGHVVMDMYGQNFAKQWATLKAQYNPVENYRMTETEAETDEKTHGHTLTITDNLTHRKTGSTTDTPATTTTENTTRTPNTREETENSVAGFNSSSMSDQSVQVRTETGTENTQTTTAITGNNTETYNTTESDTGTKTHANSGADTQEVERNLTRYGNIGVTTTQQMLQQERELWQWNFIEQVVFPAVDKVLCAVVY